LEKADSLEEAVHDLIKTNLTEHQRIIFSGDGYSDAWVEEAERRGLPNIKSTIEAAEALTTDKAVSMYEKFHIFTRTELESRREITYDTYAKAINIEALTMIDMASKQILPAVVEYIKTLADTVNSVKAAGIGADTQIQMLTAVNDRFSSAQKALENLKSTVDKAAQMPAGKEKAFYFKDGVKVAMDELRKPCDELEMLVDKKLWPVPTYGELMFEV